MIKFGEDWEYNVLGIYNYNKAGPFDGYFDFIKKHHKTIPGDIVEAGVFNGRSLLATALLLKELGSSKKVFGYDSFSGFPPIYHEKDNIEYFETLHKQGDIDAETMEKINHNKQLRSAIENKKIDVKNISSSGNFSNASKSKILQKIERLKLDNIILVEGAFSVTMTNDDKMPKQIMAAMMDCDLYDSYNNVFDSVWPRLSANGFIFLDEFYSLKFPGARAATLEFISKNTDASLEKISKHDGDFERWSLIKKSSNA